MIEASIATKVKKVVALSTDKAASPINLYGATKLCSDKLFIAANNYAGTTKISFSVVRYGNVMNSRGSVIPFFISEAKKGLIPITDKRMTRFNITLKESVNFVIKALKNAKGAEVFIPKIPSYKIMDLAKAISPKCRIKFIGIRPGEKIHEEMITVSDSPNTLNFKDYYIILPSSDSKLSTYYIKKLRGQRVPEGFCYNSLGNNRFLSIESLKELIKGNA